MADGDRCLNQLELLTLNISKFEIVFSVYGEAIFCLSGLSASILISIYGS